MGPRKSDIPENVVEVEIREYRQEDGFIYFQVKECILNNEVVGQRAYDSDGALRMEMPLKSGKKHGREYIWDEEGFLESVEPYVDGKMHGLAKQYNRKGKVIGTYRFVHGNGYDIWRCEAKDGSVRISEIFTVRDGALHGFEWWVKGDQRSVWHERHWQRGIYHGIERMWNTNGRLKRGYPKYWVQGKAVRKRAYVRAAEKDKTLPPYLEEENRPQRKFPDDIEGLASQSGV